MLKRTNQLRRGAKMGALGAALLMLSVAGPARAAQTGHVWAWGNNSYGQLGNGTNVESSVPVQVRGPGSGGFLDGVRSVDGGAGHSVAKRRTDFFSPDLFSESAIWAWGLNSEGQLGDGTTDNSSSAEHGIYDDYSTSDYPKTAVDVDVVSAGDFHTLYATFLGVPAAWGRNTSGEHGRWSFARPYYETPLPTILPNGGVTAVSAGGSHSLALRLDGTVFAWGDNSFGQLGNGSTIVPTPTTDSARPIQVGTRIGRRLIPLNQVAAIAAGGDFSLALKKDGTVWAWGYNGDGELGNGTTSDSAVPVQVSGLTDVIAIAAGDRHSLAVKSDGSVWTWGYNGFGQLGDLSLDNRSTPVRVFALGGVTAVAGGGFHSLALLSDGTVRAWGYNYFGQLGNGTTNDSSVPVTVTGLTGVFAIGAGTLHSLAVRP